MFELRRLRSPQRTPDVDNRLHTQGPLHSHHKQGGTQVFESEAKIVKALTNWVFKARAELDAVEPTPTPSIVAPNYHPDYGYPNYYRVWAMECAQLCGVSFAAITYNVGQSTIYRWMADTNQTKTIGKPANN
jgi:hypothetical protein